MTKRIATTEERLLHSAILKGDDLALAKLYDLFGEAIINSLSRYYKAGRMDEALVFDAVNQAFLGYYRNPATFNPEKNSLQRFLEIAAERDLINILDREKKHSGKIKLPEDVELQENIWNNNMENVNSTDSDLIQKETLNAVDKELGKYFDVSVDVTLAKMVLQKIRETELYAEVLNISYLSIDQQKKQVKNHKDRIKKVLERNQLEDKLKKLIK